MAVIHGLLRAALFCALVAVLAGCGSLGYGPKPSIPESDLWKVVKANNEARR